jgi:hypothetical protein
VEVLPVLRDATPGWRATPDDRLVEDELHVVPILEMQADPGSCPAVMERARRVDEDAR